MGSRLLLVERALAEAAELPTEMQAVMRLLWTACSAPAPASRAVAAPRRAGIRSLHMVEKARAMHSCGARCAALQTAGGQAELQAAAPLGAPACLPQDVDGRERGHVGSLQLLEALCSTRRVQKRTGA